jgi:hypothetical protein
MTFEQDLLTRWTLTVNGVKEAEYVEPQPGKYPRPHIWQAVPKRPTPEWYLHLGKNIPCHATRAFALDFARTHDFACAYFTEENWPIQAAIPRDPVVVLERPRQCPRCGHADLAIAAKCQVMASAGRIFADAGSLDFDESADCRCTRCGYTEELHDFLV